MGSVLGFPGIDPMDAVVGARIRRWRDRRGVAFADLAAAIDLTPEALRRVEAGREHLDSAQLRRRHPRPAPAGVGAGVRRPGLLIADA
ncbi:helix-turn-helix domain-containing protein [Brevundimonas diminuta]|uniref:helix-turn-helix domain-containing protein n=1 Tax=Brevundimonas diminuta TaxID=293 RepID=UPI003D9A3A60